MCIIDDTKDVIIEYKNIYDYEGNRQAWKEYGNKLKNIELKEGDNEVVLDEEEYWKDEVTEWKDIL